MSDFFILNDSKKLDIPEKYSGYVVFYAKSNLEATATIQADFFAKLIQNALKLSLENFLFVDVSSNKTRFAELQKTIEIKKCFLFGVMPSTVGINMNLTNYQLCTFAAVDFLLVDTPEFLEKNKQLKSQLWTQLQISFKLS